MTTKCRCCNGELDVKNLGPTIGAVTEGLCFRCTANRNSLEGVNLQSFIDTLIVPTIVVDRKGSIQTVNEKARSLFNKDLFFFKGQAPGNVFECEYARLPAGCGQTVHCSGCAIRMAITETFTSGRPVIRRGATLRFAGKSGAEEIRYYISTRKTGDAVILQIEDCAQM
jgi:hypothetical protein